VDLIKDLVKNKLWRKLLGKVGSRGSSNASAGDASADDASADDAGADDAGADDKEPSELILRSLRCSDRSTRNSTPKSGRCQQLAQYLRLR